MILRLRIRFILVKIYLIFSLSTFGQNIDSTGSIEGTIRDSSLNYYLQSATVAVYKASNDSLITYTLSNVIGEFNIKNVPFNVQLEITVSFIGFESYSFLFKISRDKKINNIGEINLKKNEKLLESVVIKQPPVEMHGDTLEFSAQAFKLDKNAVAEDLLKKLPGIIVWGDGSITVNGRQINKLLVDGKPFFGSDPAVAIQNIPKSAIEKVQVYQQFIDPTDPFDSIMSINLKLKNDQHSGYFGMASTGIGTNKKYEAGINSNTFSEKNQLALVGQSNNTNKFGNDLNTLLRNNTYKGTGAHVEYQPDFSIPGTNRQNSGGFLFSHDFIPEFNQYKQNRLMVNSFFNSTLNNTLNETQTVNFIGADSVLKQNSNSNSQTHLNNFNIVSRYNKRKNEDSLVVIGSYDFNSASKKYLTQNQTLTSQMELLSKSYQNDTSFDISNKISLQGFYNHQGFYNSHVHKLTNWSIFYLTNVESGSLNKLRRTDFYDTSNMVVDEYYNRKYNNVGSKVTQNISMQLGDFSSWLFGKDRVLSKFQITFKNDFVWDFEKQNNFVQDGDTISNSFLKNNYLSRIISYKKLNEISGFKIGRIFYDILTNRYQKDLGLFLDAKIQIFNQNYSSNLVFQNFDNTYYVFMPSAVLNYNNFQYGEYINRYSLNFNIFQNYPVPDQIAPLVDSSNIYSIREGNMSLKPEKNYVMSLWYRHESYGPKNPLNYGSSIEAGTRTSYFGDSLTVDKFGRYFVYTVNLNGNRYLRGNIFLNKAFTFNHDQLQINLTTTWYLTRNPGFINYQTNANSQLVISNLLTQSDSLSIYYTYKNFLVLNFLEGISYYSGIQNIFTSGNFISTQTLTRLGIGLNIAKRLSLNSNISYNQFTNSKNTNNKYTIWNAFISYRSLPSNNLELKLSALDLLNQNRGIINFGNNYFISHEIVNMQHQYFMVTISYFPRRFKKTTKTK